MKELIDQTAGTTRSYQAGVEWPQGLREVNHRHNLIAERLSQLEEYIQSNDLTSSRDMVSNAVIHGALRELHAKVHSMIPLR